MVKVVVILGANGALGKAVSTRFAAAGWISLLSDVSGDGNHPNFVKLGNVLSVPEQALQITTALSGAPFHGVSVNAVVNTSGGFRMDNPLSSQIFENLDAMYSSSVQSSALAAHIAAKFLAPGGLLVLPGAAAAIGGTPWALSYGAMKAAVHQMVKSLAGKNSGLPLGTRTVGIAPVMLDTPANRSSMPEADFSCWTPTAVLADEIFQWAAGTKPVDSGYVYKVATSQGSTVYTKL